ncbi:synembryn [Harmonia axyridis]|uniref:synembryn n=1 Tax=Harmonia axyridis TaxID=115357 RepID=UPI001E279542|nr:synembryn [Harmonia axyridis]
MDETNIKSIIAQNENSKKALKTFISQTENFFSFPLLNENNLRFDLWNSLYNMANTSSDEEIQANCFSALRILCREKANLDQLFEANDWLTLLKRVIGLDGDKINFTKKTSIVAVEAEKFLCNLVFNNNKAVRECSENDILYNINDRIKFYSEPSFPEDIKFFDMKLLFIITALRPETRKILGEEKNATINLMEYLDIIFEDVEDNDKSMDMACEILKTLFNLTLKIQPSNEQSDRYIKLVQILRKYLMLPIESEVERITLQTNVINLLTNIPNTFYTELIPPIDSVECIGEKLEYNGHDLSAVKMIVELLRVKISADNPVNQQLEIISPTVTVLYNGACGSKIIRKYLRFEILPPLRDVYNLPEEGTTLRNCLCRFLTSPVTILKDIIAEFLFVLCKKNVKRMVKYTGFGNAAGLFAKRGLLGGKKDAEAAEFSSDSEDSETEEYAENKHMINPVLGCYRPSNTDVLDGMSDEQKEYEAMKIINLMDALTREGTIKPCKIDENGRPVPIEHVLEFQNSLKKKDSCQGSVE